MAPRRNAPSAAAEISLAHLQNCLVNLPGSLVSLLVNVNTPAQNVIVELNYRTPASSLAAGQNGGVASQRSVYVGWTGMPSKRRVAPLVGRDGINGTRGASGSRDQEVPLVEVDAALANTLGLYDGQKVTAIIHTDPPLAHTVNIEPLTSEDWEIIELHATFLELNLLSQIRALPNPAYSAAPGVPSSPHPLTLHLSPTSTANIKILSLDPPLPSDVPFAKIGPDAEVIVAPKTRSKPSRSRGENASVASTSKKSARSAASTVRRKSARDERKPSLFFRGVDRRLCAEWFDDESGTNELSVWVDRDLLLSKELRSSKWVAVTLMRPSRLQPSAATPMQPQEGQGAADGSKPSAKVVAHLHPWDDPPNGQTAALSTQLCAAFGAEGCVGGVVKIEPAPQPLSRKSILKTDNASQDEGRNSVQHLKVYPFITTNTQSATGLKFGGESKAEREEAMKSIKHIYSGKDGKGILDGPLTDGLVLGVYEGLDHPSTWEGGIIRFHPTSSLSKDSSAWISGSDWQIPIEVQPPIPRPQWLSESVDQSPSPDAVLVGIDALLEQIQSHLSHMSSVLLTGALGAGKTSVAQAMAHRLKTEQLFHTTYFACRTLVNDESRISTIKETLTRVFMSASWGARLGGKAVVILDDLDRLCPVETELQVGNENGRSRQVSEALSAIVRRYCGQDSNVVLLATVQGKESLHNVVVGGHVVREIVALKAPDKEARRRIMEAVAKQGAIAPEEDSFSRHDNSRPPTADGSITSDENAWMDGPSQPSRLEAPSEKSGFLLEADLDFLDIAGQTDGYMPGDLNLLIARARSEALMRSFSEATHHGSTDAVALGRVDFDNALKGFTPASLRNVSLQSSTTTFDSIGGLTETRRILLETLQYPTKYAPIFAQCPLRLRSGLLLYGYPGCGKTLLASAVAGECGLNFISVKGPEILNKYIGASEKSVRDLFERAQAAKPCVLFFDEFDSIAPKRGHDSTGVTDRVVNQLLTQMDGAEGLSGVYVLAATSRPDLIDPALLRPGRLDKSILCDFPSVHDRLDIIKAVSKKVKLSDEVSQSEDHLMELARLTEGFTGADLQALLSNAQLEAIHDVLDDHGAPQTNGSSRRAGARDTTSKASGGAASRNFLQFRYGPEEALAESERRVKAGTTRSAQLAEQAAIAAKLEAIKLARRRAKHQKGHALGGDTQDAKAEKDQPHKEVVIGWEHLVKALDDTRASISTQERARLERIYREFVVGRSGEMRDGQGSMEIGGRSSLM
ncbi:Peroxisome biosynthesis protein PAS1 [Pleurostoma richardsiae]|uniref:Peroxisomal ATPase PEX1 n=1 Tax=Pleurostoma richardsiae TaxID=41990 RepID=A0AA38RBN3_9PEZI|nr:Peroxisome biosynthesis protein PAS1 [Pleurostoma richardsiae]